MFKKFSVAEDVSTQTAVKSSVVRGVKKSVTDQFPAIEDYLDDILPKKGDVLEGKGKDRSTFLIVEGEPQFFKARDGPFLPTLRLLHKYPIMMPRIQVDKGAIRFVLGGANIMCPGITSKGGAIPVELPEGAPVAVYAEGKEHALAIGILCMSTEDMCVRAVQAQTRKCRQPGADPQTPVQTRSRTKNKGIAIEVQHYLGDDLWASPSFS